LLPLLLCSSAHALCFSARAVIAKAKRFINF
jgi:hypothetical protein